MAIQSFQLDPSAAAIATAAQGAADAAAADAAIAAAAAAAAVLSDDQVVGKINSATAQITRVDALDAAAMKLVKTNPLTGEFPIVAIQRDATGKVDVDYDDVAV